MKKSIILLSSIMIMCFARAQVRVYETVRWQGDPPVLDGKITESAWSSATWSGEFIQTEPYDSAAPSQKTEFAVLYDDDHLYVAIRAYDTEPEKIEKRMSRRDNMDGDLVFFSVDSYFDKRTAFEFGVSAAGVKVDMSVSNDIEDDESWDPVWYVKTSVDSLGWIAEMRIPYTQLRFAEKGDHVWGLQVAR